LASHSVLQDHQSLRKRAASAIHRLAEVADEDGGSVTHQKRTLPRGQLLREVGEKLEKNVFVLAVVGEFSRGKSSLINALLDRPNLLPTAIEPSTAAITVLSYAPDLRVSVTFKDGTVKDDVRLEDLPRYAVGRDLDGRQRVEELRRLAADMGPSRWPNGLSQADLNLDLDLGAAAPPTGPAVETIQIGLPSSFLRDGICLVDTPGIGSVNPQHGEATRNFIHRADAVLFLVNTDPVISQSECNFLAFLKDYVKRFLFVVTKIDRFSPRERQQSVAYTARTIEEHAGLSRPPIYPVSARLAVLGRAEPDEMKYRASGFPEFLSGLHTFLVNARGKEFLTRQVNVALTQLQELTNAALMELQGLKMSLEDLPANIASTRLALRQAEVQRRQVLTAMEQRLRRIDAAMEGFSGPAKVRLELYLAAEVERLVDGYDWQQLQRVSETIPIFIRDLLAGNLGPEFAAVAGQMASLRDDVLELCRGHVGAVSAQLGARFEGLRLPEQMPVALDFDPQELSTRLQRIGTYTIGYTLALTVAGIVAVGPLGALVILGGLIARQTMTSSLRNDVKRRLKLSLGPALNRLLADLFHNVREEVSRSVTQFREEVEEYLHGTTAGIDETLSRLEQMRPTSEAESSERQHLLRVRLTELEQLHGELSSLTEPEW
jgi:GTP-binding protein EngB required for normal cell division